MAVESGETVRGDMGTLNGYLGNYNTQIGDLAGNWEGSSYDALTKAANTFYSECEKIGKGMELFAKACDKYNNEYLAEKRKKEDREKHRAEAKRNNTDGVNDELIRTYNSEISECETNMKNYKKEIVGYLSEAASIKIDGASAFLAGAGSLTFSAGINLGNGDYVLLNCDLNAVANKFGSQMDNKGIYSADSKGCDDYARGYCIYAQTGIAPNKNSVSTNDSKSGLQYRQISAGSRKEQAEIAYERLVKEGKPSVIHINSSSSGSGLGHWVTVVGYKQGVTKETVKVDDLVIIDPATGTVRSMSEDKEYCRTDLGRCRADPGYHVNYYV